MASNVINFEDIAKYRENKNKVTPELAKNYSFSEEVDKEASSLAEALDISIDDAMELATDFYRKYPMLIEHVRSPENLLRK